MSISHSAGWVVVVADGELSRLASISKRLARDILQAKPVLHRRRAPRGRGSKWRCREYLTSAWAVKEAYMKAIGTGARFDFRELEVP